MPTKYIRFSGDIETAGPVSPLYTITAIGFCTLERKNPAQFYVELKPITLNHEIDAMRVGCRGLTCVIERKGDPLFDPDWEHFDPYAIFADLTRTGIEPEIAIPQLVTFIDENALRLGGEPQAVYDPASFESSHLPYYFHKYAGRNPFGHRALDLGSYLRGALGDDNAKLSDLNLRPNGKLPHHALKDAGIQGEETEAVEKIARENYLRREMRHPTR